MKYLITSGCSFTRQEWRCNTEGNCFDFENDFNTTAFPVQRLFGEAKLYSMPRLRLYGLLK